MLKKTVRLWHTLRPVPPAMLAWRLYRAGRNLYQKTPIYLLLQPQDCPPAPRHKPLVLLTPATKTEGRRLAKDRTMVFAESEGKLGGTLNDWLPKKQSALWVFHAHYHDFLLPLHTANDPETTRDFLENWLRHFFDPHPTAWHPYPTSLRLVNWLAYAPWFLEKAPKDFAQPFWLSVFRQAKHLEKNLEKDLGGNHYIKNLKALLFVALLWPKAMPNRWHWEGKLKQQLAKQILPDGVHFERSPQYHAQVLQDVLELKLAYQHARKTVPTWLNNAAVALAEGLAGLVYPDGNLGHWNDGHPLTDKHLKRLQTVLPAKGKSQLPAAGFYTLQRQFSLKTMLEKKQTKKDWANLPAAEAPTSVPRMATQNWFVACDGGNISPSENPGHAHASPLAFELLVNTQRVFVNRGTYGYQVPDRLKWRGTQSYNTVQVGRENAADVWGTFRVGRRYRISHVRSTLENEAYVFEGTHDGYSHLGVQHTRQLSLSEKGLYGTDALKPTGKQTRLKTSQPAVAHFTVHPSVSVKHTGAHTALLTLPDGTRLRFSSASHAVSVKPTTYSPALGVKEPTQQLVLQCRMRKAIEIAWQVMPI